MRALLAPRRELVLMWLLGSVAMLSILLIRETDWVLVWPRASAIADEGTVFAAPVLAGIACLYTQRRRAARPESLLSASPRSAVVRRAADLLRLGTIAVLVAVTGHAVAWMVALVQHAGGTPVWRYPVFSATTLVVMTLLGSATGRIVRLRVAAVGMALAVAVLMMLWPYTDGLEFWLIINGWPQITVSTAALVSRVVLCLVLASGIALMSRTALWRSWSALMVVLATVMLVAQVTPPVVLREPGGQVCTGDEVVVCLWKDNERYLPQTLEAVAVVQTATAGTLPSPVRPLLEEGLDPAASSGSINAVSQEQVTVRLGRSGLTSSIASAWIGQFPSCPETGSWDLTDYDALAMWQYWVEQRIAATLGTSTSEWTMDETLVTELDRVAALPEDEQIAWAGEQALLAQGCAS